MSTGNDRKNQALGIPFGTACNRLRKQIMFHLVRQLGMDICFQCNTRIESVSELSIEHKLPWLYDENPADKFFDLDNIAFSHLSCNVKASVPDRHKYPRKAASSHRIINIPTNKSGYRGVTERTKNSYRAYANDGKGNSVNIGHYKTPELAAIAHDEYITANDLKVATNKELGLL